MPSSARTPLPLLRARSGFVLAYGGPLGRPLKDNQCTGIAATSGNGAGGRLAGLTGAYAALPLRLSVMGARYRTTCQVANGYPMDESLSLRITGSFVLFVGADQVERLVGTLLRTFGSNPC